MRVFSSKVADLTPELYKEITRLNMRRDGLLQGAMQDARKKYFKKDRVFYVIKNNKVASVGLAFCRSEDDWTGYFYTRVTMRQQGCAAAIRKKMTKRVGKFDYFVAEHNRKFFEKQFGKKAVKKRLQSF